MKRKYAEKTTVPIAKSRGEIDKLLRSWGALGVQWTDEFEAGRMALRFTWVHDETRYQARFLVDLEATEDIREQSHHLHTGAFSRNKFEKAMDARGRQEHRMLLLLLKAAFNAVDAGVMSAEQFFLPWIEDATGQTVAEQILPEMKKLLTGNATSLLGLASGNS